MTRNALVDAVTPRIAVRHCVLRIRRLFTDGSAAGEFDFAARIDGEDFDEDLFTFLEDIGHIVHVSFGEFGNMNHAVGSREDLDECAEVHDFLDCAEIDVTGLCFANDVVDHLKGLVNGHSVVGSDRHGTIIIDVDLRAGDSTDILNIFATGTDDFTNLILFYFDRFNARGIFAL